MVPRVDDLDSNECGVFSGNQSFGHRFRFLNLALSFETEASLSILYALQG